MSWSDLPQGYEGPCCGQVRRSALVLQALTYQLTGALVAAPTTSLPRIVGGDANWDYWYGWPRHAGVALKALRGGSCPDEADRYFDWIARASGSAEGGTYRPCSG